MGKQPRRGRRLIKQRQGSPFWYCNFSVGGRRFRGSLETVDESKAAILAANIRAAALKGGTIEAKKEPMQGWTLDLAIGSYWDEVGQHASSAVDIKRRLETARQAIGPDTLLIDVTMGEIAKFIAWRRGTVAIGRATLLSPAAINREITILRATLLRANTVHAQPIAKIKWSSLFLDEPDEREIVLTRAQEASLFDHLRHDYWPLVSFAILSGQRLDNIRTLRWAQIDWERRVITFQIKSRRPGGKTHIIPLTEAEIAILSVERGRHPEYVFTYECQAKGAGRRWGKDEEGNDIALERVAGERYPFSLHGWRRDWRNALAGAGLDEARFHDLRHTAAMRTLAAAKGNIKVVQRLLGHSSLGTSLRYLRANVDDVREAMELAQKSDTKSKVRKKA